jgi:GT2 family glycosyltransferase
MQPRVTVVLVARNGAEYLPRTLAAIAAQTRRPDRVVPVDAASNDRSGDLLVDALPGQLITTPGRRSFGGAIAHMLPLVPALDGTEWLWLLGHDNAPSPGALSALLGAVEVAPSVAIAGPKLMQWDDPAVIATFGETLTPYGRAVPVVADELDQAQHDIQSDLLGVSAGGMLVRRDVFAALGGFDPGLPSADAGLDLAVRARLAGHRVIGVPAARVASAGPIELFGRRSVSVGAQARIRRTAQLHRRLVYAPALAVPLHWLTLLPLAVVRALGQLIAKRPGAVGGELAAAFAAAFDATVPGARRRLRRNRVLGWASIAALRMSWSEVRERRAHDRAISLPAAAPRTTPGFFGAGGAWVVLLALLAGVLAFGRFINAPAIIGGAVAPLSASVTELWSHVGVTWRDIGTGEFGAGDPFTAVLAVLGTLSFWSPSSSLVLLWIIAMPLSALTAWWCAARLSTRGWAPGLAAVAWAVAPPLLAGLTDGRPGAVLAHVLLPALVLAMIGAARSWTASAVGALLFAVIAAAAPVLVPALVVMVVAWLVARPRGVIRIAGLLVPAAALYAPLVIEQVSRGQLLALLADPGVPAATTPPSGWQLALGAPEPGLSGWESFAAGLGLPPGTTTLIVVVLLAPLALLAILALFLPGSSRSIPAMVVALLGFVSAVAATHISVTLLGSTTTTIWAGSALSLYWLGLVGASVACLEAFGRGAGLPTLVSSVALVALAVPLLVGAATGAATVRESTVRMLPAFVSAEAVTDPTLGTLELTAQADGGLAATIHRGTGTTLDEQSTLAATDAAIGEPEERLAVLAGNLASRSGFDVAAELDALQLAFVLLPSPASAEAEAVHQRAREALDGNRLLTPIGDTADGFLWYYEGLSDDPAPSGPGNTDTPIGLAVLIGQGVIVGLTVLMAIPTSRRRRVKAARVTGAETTDDAPDEGSER